MPGTTLIQTLPYPFINEAATPVSVQNLANTVDSRLTADDANRALAVRKDTAQATRATGAQALTLNTATVLTFDTEQWDTNALYAPGTPDRLTIVRTGLYWIWGSFHMSTGSTKTVTEAAIRVSGTPVILSKEAMNPNTGGYVSVSGLYRVTAAQTVQLHGYWTGSGGPFNAAEATLGARLVAI